MIDWISRKIGTRIVTKEYNGKGEPDEDKPLNPKPIIILTLTILGFFILRRIL